MVPFSIIFVGEFCVTIYSAQDVNYCTIAPQEGSFNIVYDGTYAIVYKS